VFLFEQLVRRELRQKYQGSVLGIAWYVVNPVVLMVSYWFLFDVVLETVTYDDYPLFLLCGLVVWVFFSQSLSQAATSLLDQGALIRKARFDRTMIPAAVVTVQFVTFLVVLALVAVLTIAIRGTLDVALLLLPVVVACLAAFVLGLSVAAASLHAHFRDVAPILSAALLPWFFLSPIFFAAPNVTDQTAAQWAIQWLNPVAPFIQATRDVLYGGDAPSLSVLAYIVVAAAVAVLFGRWVFARLDPDLAVLV
jgi:lipopolysaccharide transport system permease protein